MASKKFDQWVVFFKREWKNKWPYLLGAAIGGIKFYLEEYGMKSPFAENYGRQEEEEHEARRRSSTTNSTS